METGSRIRLVLWKAAKSVERVDRASIAETGLGLTDFAIMEALLHKGPLTINVIGEKVLLTSGSMTAAVNRLEKSGMVTRRRDALDGRRFTVHLTRGGRKMIREAFGKHCEILDKTTNTLSEKEREDLIRLLKKLGRNAEKIAGKHPFL